MKSYKNCRIQVNSEYQSITMNRDISGGVPSCIEEAFDSVGSGKLIGKLKTIEIEAEHKEGLKKLSGIN